MRVSLWLEDAIATAAFLCVLAFAPLVLSLERAPSIDQDAAWHRRHERQSADCRGQQYIAQCCEDARTDLTCITAELKGPK